MVFWRPAKPPLLLLGCRITGFAGFAEVNPCLIGACRGSLPSQKRACPCQVQCKERGLDLHGPTAAASTATTRRDLEAASHRKSCNCAALRCSATARHNSRWDDWLACGGLFVPGSVRAAFVWTVGLSMGSGRMQLAAQCQLWLAPPMLFTDRQQQELEAGAGRGLTD